jgi:four helix bundle protein
MKDAFQPTSSNPLREKSYAFALRIIKASQLINREQREYVLSNQLMRAGTSIGANIAEAAHAQSKPDFVSKLSIALKECVETEYWISLLRDSGNFTAAQATSLLSDCTEIKAMLIAAVKTSKKRMTAN